MRRKSFLLQNSGQVAKTPGKGYSEIPGTIFPEDQDQTGKLKILAKKVFSIKWLHLVDEGTWRKCAENTTKSCIPCLQCLRTKRSLCSTALRLCRVWLCQTSLRL
jgi:hypothetical protein